MNKTIVTTILLLLFGALMLPDVQSPKRLMSRVIRRKPGTITCSHASAPVLNPSWTNNRPRPQHPNCP